MSTRRADDQAYTLLSSGSATGSAVSIKGGTYIVQFSGTISGATISLQVQDLAGVWADVEVFTANAIRYTTLPKAQTGVSLPAGNVRVALSGGTPSGISAYLVGLG